MNIIYKEGKKKKKKKKKKRDRGRLSGNFLLSSTH